MTKGDTVDAAALLHPPPAQGEQAEDEQVQFPGFTASVSIKLPPFWTRQPEAWFSTIEAQFCIKGVSSEQTKFNYLVAALPQEVSERVLENLRRPDRTEPYSILRSRLLSIYSLSEYQRAEQLLQLPQIGGQKPSELLDSMFSLLPEDQEPDFLFTTLFLRALPVDIRSHLVHLPLNNPRAMSSIADALWAARGSPPVSFQQCELQHTDAGDGVYAMPNQRRPQQQPRPHSTRNPSSSQRLCFYHHKFGNRANKCNEPCSWQVSGNGRSSR